MDYQQFLEGKRIRGQSTGFKPVFMPDFLFQFQAFLVNWSIERGKAAIFADCGL